MLIEQQLYFKDVMLLPGQEMSLLSTELWYVILNSLFFFFSFCISVPEGMLAMFNVDASHSNDFISSRKNLGPTDKP